MRISVFIAVVIYVVFALWLYINAPTTVVYVSYSTGSCVSIEREGVECDCSTLNIHELYERVWVK